LACCAAFAGMYKTRSANRFLPDGAPEPGDAPFPAPYISPMPSRSPGPRTPLPPRPGAVRLGDLDVTTVSVRCSRCSRAGRYRLSSLTERFGAAAGIPDVLEALAEGCPYRGREGCAPYIPELLAFHERRARRHPPRPPKIWPRRVDRH
jgi:hypothetical protein